MTQTLSSDLVARYHADGVLFPRPAVGQEAAAGLLAKFEALERHDGGAISRRTNHKPHLLLCWLAELVRDPRILDQVEALIGPDILCWATDFFVKNPGDRKRVSWHQDSTYWGLSSPEVVTAWIAFTPSTTQSGCLRVVPGSHLKDQLPHRDTFAPTNMLSRGQEVAVEVKESDAVDVVLAPGDMSLHSVRLIHGSEPNNAAHRRIGFAIRYIPTRIRQLNGSVDSASLVRGKDAFGNFAHEPAPAADFHPDAVAFHTQNYDLHMNILYAGAEQRPDKAG
jgi:ectoine hydroxylase-related dioxygenase (phytanoyl-CoA dioxygenase family)